MSDIFNMADTWNNGATTFTAIKMDVTDTASNAASLLMQLQTGGVNQLTVSKTGGIVSSNGFFGSNATQDYIQVTTTLNYYSGGNRRFIVGAGAAQFGNSHALGWSSTFDAGGTSDLSLFRDAADVLAQRRSTNAQSFRVYNTFTDASNYERGSIGWVGNSFVIASENAGTGASRSTVINSGADVQINTAGTGRWLFQSGTGRLLPLTNNAIDIGASPSNTVRNIHMGSWIRMATTTVASLPAAATAAAGARMFVTDALTPVFGSAVTGGGAVTVPVYSTGSAWNVG